MCFTDESLKIEKSWSTWILNKILQLTEGLFVRHLIDDSFLRKIRSIGKERYT